MDAVVPEIPQGDVLHRLRLFRHFGGDRGGLFGARQHHGVRVLPRRLGGNLKGQLGPGQLRKGLFILGRQGAHGPGQGPVARVVRRAPLSGGQGVFCQRQPFGDHVVENHAIGRRRAVVTHPERIGEGLPHLRLWGRGLADEHVGNAGLGPLLQHRVEVQVLPHHGVLVFRVVAHIAVGRGAPAHQDHPAAGGIAGDGQLGVPGALLGQIGQYLVAVMVSDGVLRIVLFRRDPEAPDAVAAVPAIVKLMIVELVGIALAQSLRVYAGGGGTVEGEDLPPLAAGGVAKFPVHREITLAGLHEEGDALALVEPHNGVAQLRVRPEDPLVDRLVVEAVEPVGGHLYYRLAVHAVRILHAGGAQVHKGVGPIA